MWTTTPLVCVRLCVRAGDRFACWPVCDGSFNLACRNAFTHTLVARVRACVNQMACTFIVFLYFIRMVIYALGSGALSNTTYLPLCLSHSLCSNPNVRQMQRSISCFVFGTGEFRMDTFPASQSTQPFRNRMVRETENNQAHIYRHDHHQQIANVCSAAVPHCACSCQMPRRCE